MQSGRSVDREELSDLLWDPQQGRDARHNLRQCLVDLRKLLDPFPGLLVTERDAVALNSDLCQVDAIFFAKCVEAGDLERASALHKGIFLKGLNIAAESFGTWVGNERSRLSTIAENLLEQIVRLSLSSGDGKKAIAAAERLVALDPLHENWQRILLQAYAKFRGRHAAIMHAQKFVACLKRDLDVMPEPETLALLDQIRTGDIKPQIEVNSSRLAS